MKLLKILKIQGISYQNVFYFLAKYLLILTIFILPFFFLTNTSNFVLINKTFLLAILLGLIFLSTLNNILINKEIKIKAWIFILIFLLFLILTLTSSFLSQAKYYSLYGLLSSSHSFLAYILYFLTFLISIYLLQKEDIKILLFSFPIIFFISNIFTLFVIFQKPLTIVGIFFIGSISDLVIFISLGLFFSLLISFNLKSLHEIIENKKLFYFITVLSIINLLISMFLMTIINFNQIWLLLSLIILALLAYKHFHFKPLDKESFYWLTILTIFIILYFFSSYLSIFLNNIFKTQPIVESRPNLNVTLQIAFRSLNESIKNLLLGTGPNTFLYTWLKYKPQLPYQPLLRFEQGYNFLFTLLSETGFLAFITFFFFLLCLLLLNIQNINLIEVKLFYPLGLILALSTLYYPLGLVNGIYMFFLLGMITSISKEDSLKLEIDKNKFTKITSFIIWVLLVVTIIYFLYSISLKYIANVYYAKGILSFQNNNLDSAINNLVISITIDPTTDLYYRDLSFLMMQKLNQSIQNLATTSPQTQQFILNSLSNAINSANTAILLNPKEPLNYSNLASIYQNLGLNNQQVLTLVVDNYKKAIELDPTNHTHYLNLGLVYLNIGNKNLAKQIIQTAYNLSLDPQILDILQTIK